MTRRYPTPGSPYAQGFTACAETLVNPAQIARVQLRSGERLDFCADAATWYRWNAGKLTHRSALGDQDLPLAQWAAAQPPTRFSVIGYRPGRRLVLFDHANHQFVKGYASNKFAGKIERHLAGAASAVAAGLGAPTLEQQLAPLAAYAMSPCPGQPLAINDDSGDSLQRLGAGIARFGLTVEHLPAEALATLQPFTMQDETDLLCHLAARTERALGALPEHWARNFAALQEQDTSSDLLALSHRDLHDGQLLQNGQQLSLLDFDLLCLAPPELDAGNLIAHLLLRILQGEQHNPALADRLSRRVLQGYAPIRHLDRTRLTAFCASTLLRLSLVYAIRPRWQHLGEPLCEAAAATLEGRTLPALKTAA